MQQTLASRRACLWILALSLTLQQVVHGFVPLKPYVSERNAPALCSAIDEGKETTSPLRKRDRFLNKLGFRRLSQDQRTIREAVVQTTPADTYRMTSVEDLDAYFADEERRFRKDNGEIDNDSLLKALDVRGDTQIIGAPDRPEYTHPVAQLLHQRQRAAAAGITRQDGAKIVLAVEGGGMRGCVTAGMIGAVHHLNLTDSFDAVYGSSAGTIIGSFLITGQLPWFGPELYYDCLTTAGRAFIDSRRLLRALGFGLLDPRLLKDVLTRPHHGKPVLSLPFLLQTTLQEKKPLDWEKFVERQKKLPLKVVVSDLKAEKSIALGMEDGYFDTLSELAETMHASCLLPGIAGPLVNMDETAIGRKGKQKYILGNNVKGRQYHPLADALVYEPLPFHSAINDGATHVVVVRSRPVSDLCLERVQIVAYVCVSLSVVSFLDRMESM
jgi:predicted patatin/cPLA2 family phospholipase